MLGTTNPKRSLNIRTRLTEATLCGVGLGHFESGVTFLGDHDMNMECDLFCKSAAAKLSWASFLILVASS